MDEQTIFNGILEGEKAKVDRNEEIWRGKFGNQYHDRNLPTCRNRLWANVLRAVYRQYTYLSGNTVGLDTPYVMELGAGQGDNLVALRNLLGHGRYVGVDVNEGAVLAMERRGLATIHAPISQLIREHTEPDFADMIVTRGFLIHVNPRMLDAVYDWMAKASKRYICMAEYYSPERREVSNYHGNNAMLWADDFAGEFLKRHPKWELIGYGFMYYRDGGNDETWFLLERK